MADAETYKLEELANEGGVSPRTVRYYVQRGLLPAPTFRGKDSSYGRPHLVRLRAIKRLQDQYLPLDAIQDALAKRSLEEIERLAEGRDSIVVPLPTTGPVATPPVLRNLPARAASRWQRIELAPGVELHVADGVDEATRSLVERLEELALREAPAEANGRTVHRPGGGGSKS